MTHYDIDPMPIHIVSGLPFETKSLKRALPARSFRVSFSVANATRARDLAFAAAAAAPAGLVSFGLAGGLNPGLAPGTLIVPTDVINEAKHLFPVTALWRAALMSAARAHGLAVESGLIAGVTSLVATPADKARLWSERGAASVDMESLAVAEAARAYDLPFVVVRAIADPASRAIPKAALAAVGADGRIRFMPVLKGIVARPSLARELLALGQDTKLAQRTLTRASRQLLPALLALLRPR